MVTPREKSGTHKLLPTTTKTIQGEGSIKRFLVHSKKVFTIIKYNPSLSG